MTRKLTWLFAVPLVGVLLVSSAHAGDKDKNPEQVFKAYSAALKKGDMKAGMSHLTRDSETTLAAGMVLSLYMGKEALDEDIATVSDGKERLKKIEDTMKRHRLSMEALRDHVKNLKEAELQKDKTAVFLTMGALVEDKPALVADVLKFSFYGKFFAANYGFTDMFDQSIKNIKIDGQQATGAATFAADGKEFGETVYFKLEDGVWKIDAIETMRNRPPPPPQVETPPRVEAPMPRQVPVEPQRGPVRRILQRLRGG